MDNGFRISDPAQETIGDYLMFTVMDGEARVPARISRTALAEMDTSRTGDYYAVFAANREWIREAAFLVRRVNPTLDLVALGSLNF